jgi:hypothetical protein
MVFVMKMLFISCNNCVTADSGKPLNANSCGVSITVSCYNNVVVHCMAMLHYVITTITRMTYIHYFYLKSYISNDQSNC